jgi:hypothetical protein
MIKARLVKRQELMEREPVARASAPRLPTADITLSAIINRMNRRQLARPLNPRGAFAALFEYFMGSTPFCRN